MSVIKKFGYKNYTGRYFTRPYRIWQICLFNLRERIWNQKSVLATFGILLFVSFIIIIPIAFITSSGSANFIQTFFQGQNQDPQSLFSSSLAIINYVLTTNPLTFILFGFIGGKIISEDIEYQSLEQYFLRVRRIDYLIGKFLALFLSYFLSLLAISFMFYYFLCSAFEFSLFEIDSLSTFLKIIFFLIILSLTATLFMLAISGATEKKYYATLIFILILLLSGDVFKLFSEFLNNNSFLILNPQEIIAVILKWLVPITSKIQLFTEFLGLGSGGDIPTTINLSEALGMVLFVSIGSIIYLFRKLTSIWS